MTGRSADEVVQALDTDLVSVAEAVGRGEYCFWIGSGISRDVVPPLAELLRRVLVHLQERTDADEPDCPFRSALKQVLLVGGILQDEIDELDFGRSVDEWSNADNICKRMVGNYSKVLEVPVEGVVESDYLLWEAIDVRDAYGNGSLQPDVEHLCLAILLLEGSIPIAVSANWDGLIESAVERLASAPSGLLDVIVDQQELRGRSATSELVKFHGCAVRAGVDESRYRKLLVATKAQVAAWTENSDYALMVSHLEEVVATRPTLMMGLSAQDANIQAIFARAKKHLPWSWPSNPPAVVLAEEAIGADQRTVLNLIYGDSYSANRVTIEEASLLGCYARPFLHGLVLWVLGAKFKELSRSRVPASWSASSSDAIGAGLDHFRNALATTALTPASVEAAALGFARALAIFRGRVRVDGTQKYEPLTSHPVRSRPDPNVDLEPLEWFAVCLGFLKSRELAGELVIDFGSLTADGHGTCSVAPTDGSAQTVFAVKDAMSIARLETAGHIQMDDSSIVVLHMAPVPQPQRRAYRGSYGRTIRSRAHEVSFSDLAQSSSSIDELAERFSQQAVV